jgi:signal transduction histidine kinase
MCLFPLLFQVDMSVTRKYGGTGLGLNIVKQLVAAHEGDVQCRFVAFMWLDVRVVS